MPQSSLLSAVKVPSDPSLLKAWAERIRGRICSLSRNIAGLEDERENLLSMLWEAGFHEYEMPTSVSDSSATSLYHLIPEPLGAISSHDDVRSSNVSDVSSVRSGPLLKSVIDLVSECDDELPENIRIPFTAQQPDSASLEIPEIQYPPTQVVPEDDTSLNHPLAVTDENIPVKYFGVNGQSDRMYRPWQDGAVIAWDRMELAELKQWMQFFGMKPSGGKAFMISQLKSMFGYINGTSPSSTPDEPPRTLTATESFAVYTDMIKAITPLYERIILFENVEVSEVMDALTSVSRPDNVPLSIKLVKDYLAFIGAQFSNTSENQNHKYKRKNRRRKRRESVDDTEIPIPKTKRQLRRSITCP